MGVGTGESGCVCSVRGRQRETPKITFMFEKAGEVSDSCFSARCHLIKTSWDFYCSGLHNKLFYSLGG